MIGQIVHSCQDTVSQDARTIRSYSARVKISNEELIYNEALCERVTRLRKGRFNAAADMALALGIPAERYRKYESRSPLPQYLIERFAVIVGRDVAYVVTGRTGQTHLRIVESARKPS